MNYSIYLAGPVQHVPDGGASWRDRIKDEYADTFNFADPLDKYNIPVEDLDVVGGGDSGEGEVSVGEIVHGDKKLIRGSDAILVGYEAVQSVGTPMEVMLAYERAQPVVLWLRDDTDESELSPWYRYHVDYITDDLESACDALADLSGLGTPD